jgi:hypothetical protein
LKKLITTTLVSLLFAQSAYADTVSVNKRPLSIERTLSHTRYGYTKTSEITRAGERSQRFEVRPGDCGRDLHWNDCTTDRERSEVRADHHQWKHGSDVWIGYSLYLPDDFKTSNHVITSLGQIGQKGNNASGSAGGFKSFPPLLQIGAAENKFGACLHILSGEKNNVKDECKYFVFGDIKKYLGKWTDVIIHFDTTDPKGKIEFFINGKLVASHKNWIKFAPDNYFLKYGIYRSFVSRHGGPMPTQIAYYDEVKIGNSKEAVSVREDNPID